MGKLNIPGSTNDQRNIRGKSVSSLETENGAIEVSEMPKDVCTLSHGTGITEDKESRRTATGLLKLSHACESPGTLLECQTSSGGSGACV